MRDPWPSVPRKAWPLPNSATFRLHDAEERLAEVHEAQLPVGPREALLPRHRAGLQVRRQPALLLGLVERGGQGLFAAGHLDEAISLHERHRFAAVPVVDDVVVVDVGDRKSTRLNSSHANISYAV